MNMNNSIIVRTEVLKIVVSEYEGEKIYKLQSIFEDERKGFSIISVKLLSEPKEIKEGDTVELPVKISAMNSNIFFTQNGSIKKVNKA